MSVPVRLLTPARQARPLSRAVGQRVRYGKRFQSSTTPSPEAKAGGGSGAVAGGLAGAAAAGLIGYSWYHFSGTKTLVNTAHQTKSYVDSAFKSSTQNAPAPDQAIQWLRETVTSYAKFVPGAQSYVNTAFDDLEKVQKKHADKVNSIIKETYDELKDVTKAGASIEGAYKAWDVLQNCFKKISSLAGDAAGDILQNHPELKEKVGGRFEQLQQMGDQFGPEAKKQVEDVKNQLQQLVKEGLNSDTISKVQKLVQDKSQELQKYGDQAWKKGIEQAKPLLDKQPELKELVEKNKDKLLQGDLSSLWQKLQEAVKTGNVDDVKKFVTSQVEKGTKSGGSGVEQLFSMFPGGSEVGSKFQQLQELSQKHGKEAEQLIKTALQDIKGVLEKKVEEGQQLKNKAEKDVKS